MLCTIAGIVTTQNSFKISYSDNFVNYWYSDLEEFAKANNIPFYKIQNNIKEIELETWKNKIGYDLIIVAGWYHMLPKNWVNNELCLGLHASLLPRYRGGAPLVWAMIEGNSKTGVTLFEMNELIDAGQIWLQQQFKIEEQDYIQDVLKKSIEASTDLITRLFLEFEVIKTKKIKVNNDKHPIYPQRSPEDGEIKNFEDWELGLRLIKSQSKPYPGAFLIQNSKKVYLWKATKAEKKSSFNPHEIFQVRQNHALLHFKNGTLMVTEYNEESIN